MSLDVNMPYKKTMPRRSLTMNSLSQRWDHLRKLAQAELSLTYPNVNLIPITSSAALKQSSE